MYRGNRNSQKQLNPNFGTRVKSTNEYDTVTLHQPRQTNSIPIDQDMTGFSYFSVIIDFGPSSE